MVAHNIPSQLVINWDQAGVKLVPSSNWTLEQEGAERVEIAGLNNKCQDTATLAGTLSTFTVNPIPRKDRGKTYGKHQTIGPMKKPHLNSSRMSFCHMFKMCARSHLFLIRLPLQSLMSLKVICVTVCTLSLKGTKFFKCTSQTPVLICCSHLT